MDPGSSWWCQGIRQEAMGRNWKFHLDMRRNFWLSGHHTLEQIAQRVCRILLIGDTQELSRQNSVLCALRWTCLSREVGLGDSLWSPPTSSLLWLCDTSGPKSNSHHMPVLRAFTSLSILSAPNGSETDVPFSLCIWL